MPSTALLAAFRQFATSILNPYDLQDLLHRLTHHACLVTGSHGAGIMLVGDDGLGFAAASDDDVIELERVQDRIQSGACHEAFETDQVMAVEDLHGVDQWPEYRARALELGFASVLGIPMRAAGQTIGVLNIYRRVSGAWMQDTIETAELLTAMGAGYVLHGHQLHAQHELATHLRTALASRDTIGQAKGLLMAQFGCSSEEAFERLRTMSQTQNRKLVEVAKLLIQHAGAPQPVTRGRDLGSSATGAPPGVTELDPATEA